MEAKPLKDQYTGLFIHCTVVRMEQYKVTRLYIHGSLDFRGYQKQGLYATMKCFHQIPVFQRDIYLFNLTTVNSVCKIIGYCLKLMVTVTSNPYSKTLCKGVWFITAQIVYKEARKTKKINNTLDKTWNKYWMLPWHDGSYMQTKVTSQIHLELKPLYRSLVITLSSDKESLYKPQHVQKPYKSTWTNQIHPQKPQNAGSVRSAISHDSCACTQASSDVGGHGWLYKGGCVCF